MGDPSDAGKKQLRIKILTMGDAGTGKSCLVKRYCEERFISKYISTIGIDYGVKPTTLKGRDVRVNVSQPKPLSTIWHLPNPHTHTVLGHVRQ